jgi:hypothetical protein
MELSTVDAKASLGQQQNAGGGKSSHMAAVRSLGLLHEVSHNQKQLVWFCWGAVCGSLQASVQLHLCCLWRAAAGVCVYLAASSCRA